MIHYDEYEMTGYVNFPRPGHPNTQMVDSGETLVYLVAWDRKKNNPTRANQYLELTGTFFGDDVMVRPRTISNSIEDIISGLKNHDTYDRMYFPNFHSDIIDKDLSIPLLSCNFIGWSKYTYEYKSDVTPCCISFRDLTAEGKKLYYSLKKLHNDKEVRILTFGNVKIK